jgi:hypothetical protein
MVVQRLFVRLISFVCFTNSNLLRTGILFLSINGFLMSTVIRAYVKV